MKMFASLPMTLELAFLRCSRACARLLHFLRRARDQIWPAVRLAVAQASEESQRAGFMPPS